MLHQYVALNVPARQSGNYTDLLRGNLPKDHVVFIDALFGGLDVLVRLKSATTEQGEYLQGLVSKLVHRRGSVIEGLCLSVDPFFEAAKAVENSYFIVVLANAQMICETKLCSRPY